MLNPWHISGRFEGNGNISKKFVLNVAVSGNNHYFCRVIFRLVVVEDGMNKFIGWSLCNG